MATKAKEPPVEQAKQDIQTIARISFDLGNRVNSLTDGSKIVSFPSYSDRLSARQDLDFTQPDFKEGRSFAVSIGAMNYKVGAIAGLLTAKPTFSGDKWQKCREFLFAGLAALGIEANAHINELRCSIPDDQDSGQRAPFELLADTTHQFKVNGKEYTVRIGSVNIAAEGKFAWLRAVKEGLLKYPQYLNGCLDLGGGTAIARLIAPNGTIARDYEKVLQGGTSELASQIAGEVGLLGVEGQIMDAIADGSFSVHAVNFKAAYDALLPVWVSNIRAEINTAWKPIQNQYAQVLIVGGSAPIFAPFVADNPRYVVAPNPQFYALEGLHNG